MPDILNGMQFYHDNQADFLLEKDLLEKHPIRLVVLYLAQQISDKHAITTEKDAVHLLNLYMSTLGHFQMHKQWADIYSQCDKYIAAIASMNYTLATIKNNTGVNLLLLHLNNMTHPASAEVFLVLIDKLANAFQGNVRHRRLDSSDSGTIEWKILNCLNDAGMSVYFDEGYINEQLALISLREP